jgi:hypothetical protein
VKHGPTTPTTSRAAGYQLAAARGRHEPPRPHLTERTARHAWVDYADVLDADRLRVLTNHADGWQPVAEPAWTERPYWDAIDQHAHHHRRGW